MPQDLVELGATLKFDDKGVDQSVDKITSSMKQKFSKAGDEIEGSLGKKIAKIGGALATGALVAGFNTVSRGVLTLADNLQKADIAFTTMLGSADKSKKLLSELSTFASKTPFELVGIRNTAKQLLAYGVEADKIIGTLKSLGDVSAGLSVPIEQVAFAFGQVKTAGRLMGGELRQFLNAGVPIIQELAKNLGVAESKIRDMVEKGQVSFADVERAFASMSGEGGRFADLMTKQSQTLGGARSNLKDSVNSLGEVFGSLFIPALTGVTNAITPMIQSLKDRIAENPSLATTIGILTTVIVSLLGILGVIGPVVGAFVSGLAVLGVTASAVFLPLTAIIGAITLLTVAYSKNRLGLQDLIDEMQGYTVESKVMDKSIKEHRKNIEDLRKKQEDLDNQYRSGKITKEQYNAESKKLDTQLRVEQQTLKNLDKNYNDYTIAQDNATNAKARLQNLKLNPNATVSAVRTEANAVIQYSKALIEAIKLKAKLFASQAGIKNFDPAKPNAIYEVDQSSVNSLQAGSARVQLNAELEKIKSVMGDIASAEDDFKNAEKIVASIKGAGGGGGGSGKKSKADEEQKKAKEEAEKRAKELTEAFKDAYKEIDDKIVDSRKKIQDYQGEIKKTAEAFKELKVKAKEEIDDINASIAGINSETSTNLGKRYVEVIKELEQVKKDGITTPENQQKLNDLEKERDFLLANTTEKVRQQAEQYNKLSEAQRSVQDSTAKIADLEERKAIAQAFSSQKGTFSDALKFDEKTNQAFYTNEKGALIEITDVKNIEYARDLENQQLKMQQEIQMNLDKINAEKDHQKQLIDAKKGLEEEFTTYLVATTTMQRAQIQSLISDINSAISAMQRLRSMQSSASTKPAGYFEGGYTGDIPTTAEAGVVHGQEYVVSNNMLKRLPGIIPALENVRAGGQFDYSRNQENHITVNKDMDINTVLDRLSRLQKI